MKNILYFAIITGVLWFVWAYVVHPAFFDFYVDECRQILEKK